MSNNKKTGSAYNAEPVLILYVRYVLVYFITLTNFPFLFTM